MRLSIHCDKLLLTQSRQMTVVLQTSARDPFEIQ